MELLTILELILISAIAGVTTAVTLASKPYQWFLNLLKLDTSKYSGLLNCGLCMGFWISSIVVAQYSNIFIGLFLGGIGSYTAELVSRKLNKIEL